MGSLCVGHTRLDETVEFLAGAGQFLKRVGGLEVGQTQGVAPLDLIDAVFGVILWRVHEELIEKEGLPANVEVGGCQLGGDAVEGCVWLL